MVGVVGNQMIECRSRSVPVKGAPLVRKGQEQNPAWPQDAIPFLQGTDRIRQVLGEMVCDDEIKAAVLNLPKMVGLGNDGGLDQRVVRHLRVVPVFFLEG